MRRRGSRIVGLLLLAGASLGAATTAPLVKPVDCNATDFVKIYDVDAAPLCVVFNGFNLFDPKRVDPDVVCGNIVDPTDASSLESPCKFLYESLQNLKLPVECRLTTSTLLYRDVITFLARSAKCTGSQTAVFPDLSIYDYGEQTAVLPQAGGLTTGQTVGIIVGSVLVLALVAACFVWKCRRRRVGDSVNGRYTAAPDKDTTRKLKDSSHAGVFWEDDELLAHQMRAQDIEDIRLIRTGLATVEYLVRFNKTRFLASKRLAPNKITRAASQALVHEIKLVAQLDHTCIVPFVGAAWTNEIDLQALFESMPNGDLTSYLANTRPEGPASIMWTPIKLRIAIDIIEALVYVHSFSPPLVHRDLKSRNVLLDAGMRAKLSEFGASRYQSDALTMTTGIGTSRWLAPEVLIGGGDYDERCDIYSFGIVLAEMDSHQLPFTDLLTDSGMALPEMTILQLVSEGKLRPNLQSSCPEKLRALMLQCVAVDPKERPSAMAIAYTLRRMARAFDSL